MISPESIYDRWSVAGAAATGRDRSRSIDALRAVAALMVLVAHAPQLGGVEHAGGLAGAAENLGVGVWIFFAVSGYLIAGPFLRALLSGEPLPPLTRYARRRAARILPAYWVAFAVLLLCTRGRLLGAWWQIPTHALLLQGLIPGELQAVYFVAWTLGLEALFYVLVPLLALAARRLAAGRAIRPEAVLRALAGIWLVAVIEELVLAVAFPLRALRPLPGGVQIMELAGPLSCFCPGMLVFVAEASADAAKRWGRVYLRLTRLPLLSFPIAVVLLVLTARAPIQTSHAAFELSHLSAGAGAGLILIAVLHAGRAARPVVRVLAPIGLVSYGIYLWHWVVLQTILIQHGPLLAGAGGGTILGNLMILLVATLPLAIASWLAIERPLIRRTTGWEQRSRGGAAELGPSVAGGAGPGISV